MDNDLILFDRIEIIKTTDKQYNLLDNSYLSFSGGKDSTILHYLLDLALPNNQIPRVFINTGIEYLDIVNFVKELAKNDSRFVIISPNQPIKPMLEKVGYPFKSKEHSLKIGQWKKGMLSPNIIKYSKGGSFGCPKLLMYQFNDDFNLKISCECCNELKKKPIHKWQKDNKRTITILGLRQEEGGQRKNHQGCVVLNGNDLVKFKPLNPLKNDWEDWFIEKYNISLCRLYYPPFNFKRTGCKGCPYAIGLQEQLDLMGLYLPNERKQCEYIWEPVYKEYRRLKYRLKSENEQLNLFDEKGE